LDAITWTMIKAEVVCENSGSNGVRTFTDTWRSWKRYFASMIVRCTPGKGIRGGQEPGVDRDQEARRRDLINIISDSTLLYRYQYFDDLYRSEPLYLAYITRVFLTSSPI